MRKIKRITALIFVLVICMTVMTPSAYADGLLGGQQFGAWISAGLMSLNIIGQSLMPAPGPVDPYFQWLSSPASATQTYEYPVGQSIIQDYLNASTIKVSKGVTTIDGVEYDELWVEPGTFTNGLKTNLFDFKTKWNILSGQSGITLASGAGHVAGLPVYQIGDTYKTASYGIAPKGSSVIFGEIEQSTADNGKLKWRKVGHENWDVEYIAYPGPWFLEGVPANTKRVSVYRDNGTVFTGSSNIYDLTFDDNAFNYGYTSGIVPAEQGEIPDDYGLSIQIPHDKLETFYNTYPQYNVDNTTINIQQDQIDIDELTQAIFDLIENMDEVKAEWTSGEEPEPPAPVDPIENIDKNVQSINDYQQNMNQQLNHMHQDVEAMHQTQQQQQQTQQEIKETSESIDSTLKDVKDAIQPGEITPKKFDLRRLFPFCIPFDIYNLLQKFDAQPQAPHVQLPFVIESIGFSYTFDLDFSAFDGLAAAMRTVELIVYCLGLAWATSKVIKW